MTYIWNKKTVGAGMDISITGKHLGKLSLFILIFIFVSLAIILIITTVCSASPVEKVYYKTGDDSYFGPSLANWYFQGFTVNVASFHLTNVSLLMYRISSPWLCNVSIRLADTSTHVPKGSDLCFGQYNVSGIATASPYTWVNFDLDPKIKLSNGTEYCIIVRCTHIGADRLRWRADTSTGYSGGLSGTSADSGVTWGLTSTTNDGMFRCWGWLVNISINATSPYNGEDYPYMFPGYVSWYGVFDVNSSLYQSDDFTTQINLGFEDKIFLPSFYYTKGIRVFAMNIFSPLGYWDGSLETGETYTFWFNYSVPGYSIWDNDSITFDFNDVSFAPLPLGPSGWDLISLPKLGNISKTSVFIINATNNYTWNDAVTNGVIMNTLYGWKSGHYTVNTSFNEYDGYWIYFYKSGYHAWINASSGSSGYTENDLTYGIMFSSLLSMVFLGSFIKRKKNH